MHRNGAHESRSAHPVPRSAANHFSNNQPQMQGTTNGRGCITQQVSAKSPLTGRTVRPSLCVTSNSNSCWHVEGKCSTFSSPEELCPRSVPLRGRIRSRFHTDCAKWHRGMHAFRTHALVVMDPAVFPAAIFPTSYTPGGIHSIFHIHYDERPIGHDAWYAEKRAYRIGAVCISFLRCHTSPIRPANDRLGSEIYGCQRE